MGIAIIAGVLFSVLVAGIIVTVKGQWFLGGIVIALASLMISQINPYPNYALNKSFALFSASSRGMNLYSIPLALTKNICKILYLRCEAF